MDSVAYLKIDSVVEGIKDMPVQFNYSFFQIDTKADLDSFNIQFTPQQRRVISDINRIDENKISYNNSIVIPYPMFDSNFSYAPFPVYLAKIQGIKKILFISKKIQAIGAYENGLLVYWAPTNTGKKSSPTPTGLFFTNWKAKTTNSTIDVRWVLNWNFNIENARGVSLHEYALPGYPASHACIRLKKEDAFWFYNWAQQWTLDNQGHHIMAYGTPVIIYDAYDFEAPMAIWKQLVQYPDTLYQNETFLNHIALPYLETILKRQSSRDSIETVL